eukprot:gb/GECH01007378.1/.p1 GENE.gb/GECH01007378.1/~~gb/GECH01007378.1/.p1  ORF type:complete len:387 (+),score=99.92 gb/GECH01007378.1/:1-1161(+)
MMSEDHNNDISSPSSTSSSSSPSPSPTPSLKKKFSFNLNLNKVDDDISGGTTLSPRNLKRKVSMNLVRRKVSKNKRRHKQDDFDLDLTYITPQIVAMGFPSIKVEGLYRNKMADVQEFVNTNHPDKYMIYNLCSERSYDASYFDGRVERFPFHDHNPPPFNVMLHFCLSVWGFLSEDPENVAFIHCKAGKGRTGLMICVYLVFTEAHADADAAMQFYGEQRTKDGKGVTIPSQKRYIYYFDQRMKEMGGRDAILDSGYIDMIAEFPPLVITRIEMSPPPNGGGRFTFVIRRPGKWYYAECETNWKKNDVVSIDIDNAAIKSDTDIHCYPSEKMNKELFHFWFNTAFIEDYRLVLHKKEIDGAIKDKKHHIFSEDFSVTVHFAPFQK